MSASSSAGRGPTTAPCRSWLSSWPRRGVIAIAATGDVASARAARMASSTLPVVFTVGGDPVRVGLVDSLNRPGGNTTGISLLSNVLGAKRVEILRGIAPRTARIALLMNPNNPSADIEAHDAELGAKAVGLDTQVFNARNGEEIGAAFDALLQAKCDSFITATDPIPLDRRHQLIELADRHRLPAVYFTRQFAVAGGLLSYGPSISWMYREAGNYIGQILKGAKPAEMPVLQPTQFEFVLNLTTAHKLGLDIPASHMALAAELIE